MKGSPDRSTRVRMLMEELQMPEAPVRKRKKKPAADVLEEEEEEEDAADTVDDSIPDVQEDPNQPAMPEVPAPRRRTTKRRKPINAL